MRFEKDDVLKRIRFVQAQSQSQVKLQMKLQMKGVKNEVFVQK